MEQFFVRVLWSVASKLLTGKTDATNEEVQAALDKRIAAVMAEENVVIKQAIADLETSLVDKFDGLDGKMGNVQEQVEGMPGKIIGDVAEKTTEGVVKGVLGPLQQMFNNIPGLPDLGGFFGQR